MPANPGILLHHRLQPRGEYAAAKRDITAEEKVAELFQPDTLMPSQFFDRVRRSVTFHGERRLMIAILEDAVEVYRKQAGASDRKRQQLFEDAEAWIESCEHAWLFSFENICDVLGFEAEYLRKGLRAWKQRIGGDRGRVVRFPEANQASEDERARANGS